jgi:predicted negative regulator of RcsB-dependent stress response
MSEQTILRAAIRKARIMVESGELSDAESFALQVLADAADASLNPVRVLALDRLQQDFSVRVSSDGGIHSI